MCAVFYHILASPDQDYWVAIEKVHSDGLLGLVSCLCIQMREKSVSQQTNLQVLDRDTARKVSLEVSSWWRMG